MASRQCWVEFRIWHSFFGHGIGIVSFFSGTAFYRFQKPGGSPLTRISQVLVASFHKWNVVVPKDSILLYETQDKTPAIKGSRKLEHSNGLK